MHFFVNQFWSSFILVFATLSLVYPLTKDLLNLFSVHPQSCQRGSITPLLFRQFLTCASFRHIHPVNLQLSGQDDTPALNHSRNTMHTIHSPTARQQEMSHHPHVRLPMIKRPQLQSPATNNRVHLVCHRESSRLTHNHRS